MSSAILPASLAIPRPTNRSFSSLKVLTTPHQLQFRLCPLSIDLAGSARRLLCPPVRMGGGPRTFPGGVSKWQWKRMQAKKAKQLLKARLLRERQIYEMRKRTELKAAVSELERPWEIVERAPLLFSRSADEQVKALADRFQRPGGFDMWSDRDGPQVFRAPDGLPSARFFPKGVVHSVKPYGIIARSEGSDGLEEDGEELRFDDWIGRGGGGTRRRSRRPSDRTGADVEANDSIEDGSDQQFGKDTRLATQDARFLMDSDREDQSPSNRVVVDVEANDSIEGSNHQFSRDSHLGMQSARNLRNSSCGELNRTEGRRFSRGNPSNRAVVDVEARDSIDGSNNQFSRDSQLGTWNARILRNSSRGELRQTEGRRVSRGGPSNLTMVDGEAKDSIKSSSNHQFSRDSHLGSRNARILRNSNREELSRTVGLKVDIDSQDSIAGSNLQFSRDTHFSTRNERFSRDSIAGSNHQFSRDTHFSTRNERFSRDSIAEGRRVSRGSLPGLSYRGRGASAESYGSSRGRGGNGRRQGFEEGGFGLDSDVIANGRDESSKMAGRGGHGSRNNRFKAGKISLRPTTDLYSEDGGGSGTRDSNRNRGNGFRTNHGIR